jgi:hypothetical protein
MGVRFYPGQEVEGSDPNSYILEGSNDGGTTYTTIASGPLALPLDRNLPGPSVDPINNSVQEILFSNTRGYTTYRVTFPDVVDSGDSGVGFLSLAEIELLGVAAAAQPIPTLSAPTLTAGKLNLAGSGGAANGTYSVLTNANLLAPLSQWGTNTTGTFSGTGTFSLSLPVSLTNAHLFYLIKTP